MAWQIRNEELLNDHESPGGGKDIAYRIWFSVGVMSSLAAGWSRDHYAVLAQIAWTIIGPGFTLSQIWKEFSALKSYAYFGVLLAFHFLLMRLIFRRLPFGHFGYVLIAGLIELMTVGFAFQVWSRLRTQ
ncbi:hypothetical protein [Terriglobus sp. TAA 43]|uniref:hypothetical protein n=1 Tax=Terriglobus sp. TAA 43 TaxID=278961 RepID=UPI0012EEA14F|nr:hypothetical protein [Terriglobus sp. TAA 43]